jgi:hypothetical protein
MITTDICGLFHEYFTGMAHHSNEKAVSAQRAVGLNFLAQGFITKQWRMTLEAHKCEHSDQKLASLIYFIWTEVVDTIWKLRNSIVHHRNNLNRQAEEL